MLVRRTKMANETVEERQAPKGLSDNMHAALEAVRKRAARDVKLQEEKMQAELRAVESDAEKKTAELLAEHNAELLIIDKYHAAALRKGAEKLEAVKRQHEAELEVMKEQHEAELEVMKEQYEAELEVMKEQYEAELQHSNGRLVILKKRLNKLKDLLREERKLRKESQRKLDVRSRVRKRSKGPGSRHFAAVYVSKRLRCPGC